MWLALVAPTMGQYCSCFDYSKKRQDSVIYEEVKGNSDGEGPNPAASNRNRNRNEANGSKNHEASPLHDERLENYEKKLKESIDPPSDAIYENTQTDVHKFPRGSIVSDCPIYNGEDGKATPDVKFPSGIVTSTYQLNDERDDKNTCAAETSPTRDVETALPSECGEIGDESSDVQTVVEDVSLHATVKRDEHNTMETLTSSFQRHETVEKKFKEVEDFKNAGIGIDKLELDKSSSTASVDGSVLQNLPNEKITKTSHEVKKFDTNITPENFRVADNYGASETKRVENVTLVTHGISTEKSVSSRIFKSDYGETNESSRLIGGVLPNAAHESPPNIMMQLKDRIDSLSDLVNEMDEYREKDVKLNQQRIEQDPIENKQAKNKIDNSEDSAFLTDSKPKPETAYDGLDHFGVNEPKSVETSIKELSHEIFTQFEKSKISETETNTVLTKEVSVHILQNYPDVITEESEKSLGNIRLDSPFSYVETDLRNELQTSCQNERDKEGSMSSSKGRKYMPKVAMNIPVIEDDYAELQDEGDKKVSPFRLKNSNIHLSKQTGRKSEEHSDVTEKQILSKQEPKEEKLENTNVNCNIAEGADSLIDKYYHGNVEGSSEAEIAQDKFHTYHNKGSELDEEISQLRNSEMDPISTDIDTFELSANNVATTSSEDVPCKKFDKTEEQEVELTKLVEDMKLQLSTISTHVIQQQNVESIVESESCEYTEMNTNLADDIEGSPSSDDTTSENFVKPIELEEFVSLAKEIQEMNSESGQNRKFEDSLVSNDSMYFDITNNLEKSIGEPSSSENATTETNETNNKPEESVYKINLTDQTGENELKYGSSAAESDRVHNQDIKGSVAPKFSEIEDNLQKNIQFLKSMIPDSEVPNNDVFEDSAQETSHVNKEESELITNHMFGKSTLEALPVTNSNSEEKELSEVTSASMAITEISKSPPRDDLPEFGIQRQNLQTTSRRSSASDDPANEAARLLFLQELTSRLAKEYLCNVEEDNKQADVLTPEDFYLDIRTCTNGKTQQMNGTVSDLISGTSRNAKILLTGKPGFGKSSVCEVVTRMWASQTKDDSKRQQDNAPNLQSIDSGISLQNLAQNPNSSYNQHAEYLNSLDSAVFSPTGSQSNSLLPSYYHSMQEIIHEQNGTREKDSVLVNGRKGSVHSSDSTESFYSVASSSPNQSNEVLTTQRCDPNISPAPRISLCILYNLKNYVKGKENLKAEILKKCRPVYKERTRSSERITMCEIWDHLNTCMDTSFLLLDGYNCLDEASQKDVVLLMESDYFKHAKIIVTSTPLGHTQIPAVFNCCADICGLYSQTEGIITETVLSHPEAVNHGVLSKLHKLHGISPLFMKLILTVLQRDISVHSLYGLLEEVFALLLEAKHQVDAQQEDCQRIYYVLGKLYLEQMKKRDHFGISNQKLFTEFDQQAELVSTLEIFHKTDRDGEEFVTIAHPVFMHFFCVFFLREAWKEIEDKEDRINFFNETFSYSDCSEEYVIDPGIPSKKYCVGVLREIVLEVDAGGILPFGLFQMRADVECKNLELPFNTANLLLRIDKSKLTLFGIERLDETDEIQNLFFDIFCLFNFRNCEVEFYFYAAEFTSSKYLKFSVLNEEDGTAVLHGIISRNPSQKDEEDFLNKYEEIYLDFLCSGLEDTYELMKGIFGNYEPCQLDEDLSLSNLKGLVHQLVLTALECSKNRYTEIIWGSTSVDNPKRLTWVITSNETGQPSIMYVATSNTSAGEIKTTSKSVKVTPFKKRSKEEISKFIENFTDSYSDSCIIIHLKPLCTQ